MEKIIVSTVWERLKKSFWLLLSTVVALCLLLEPSLFTSVKLIAFVFLWSCCSCIA